MTVPEVTPKLPVTYYASNSEQGSVAEYIEPLGDIADEASGDDISCIS